MKYDETLFAGTAGCYARYRPRYPRAVFDRIIEVFEPGGEDILLDLGCGTGEVVLPLAAYFGKVLAWDPDGEMLEIARRKAAEQGATNIVFEQKSSDDLPGLDKKIKLVTMGQSFHWMNGKSTLEEIKKHLVDSGGVAIMSARHGLHVYSSLFDEPNELTAKRNEIVREVGIKYLGEKRKAGKGQYQRGEKPWIELLGEAGFADIEETIFDETMERTVDETIGFLYSTSWGNKNQLGDKADAFEQELKEKLLALAPSGVFEEKITFDLLSAKLVF